MDPTQLANTLINQYYDLMKTNREQRMNLINFYKPESQVTYSGRKHIGLKQIQEKIESLSYETIQFANLSTDIQTGPGGNSLLVFVSGFLQMDGSEQFRFAQVFTICSNGSGGFYIHNDIFSVIN